LKALMQHLRGPGTEGAMAPELPMLYAPDPSRAESAVKEVRIALDEISRR
jgi:hypothetical protein